MYNILKINIYRVLCQYKYSNTDECKYSNCNICKFNEDRQEYSEFIVTHKLFTYKNSEERKNKQMLYSL